MADRQEFQQERSRLLRDPAAGDHTQIPDTAESVQADQDLAGAPDPGRTPVSDEGAPIPPFYFEDKNTGERTPLPPPEVEVSAAIVDEGIAVTFLIPHGLIGVALSS